MFIFLMKEFFNYENIKIIKIYLGIYFFLFDIYIFAGGISYQG